MATIELDRMNEARAQREGASARVGEAMKTLAAAREVAERVEAERRAVTGRIAAGEATVLADLSKLRDEGITAADRVREAEIASARAQDAVDLATRQVQTEDRRTAAVAVLALDDLAAALTIQVDTLLDNVVALLKVYRAAVADRNRLAGVIGFAVEPPEPVNSANRIQQCGYQAAPRDFQRPQGGLEPLATLHAERSVTLRRAAERVADEPTA